ncbi:MAG: hypothetical protein AAGA60_10660 [Cyanobacteria bacterium P01_E01_bin.42]
MNTQGNSTLMIEQIHERIRNYHPDKPPSVQDFPFAYQGKQTAQMVAFIWRWGDPSFVKNSQDRQKHEVARDLQHNYFLARDEQGRFSSQKLVDLFAANPRKWLENGRDSSGELAHEAEILVSVFGETRILDKTKYLSPIFTAEELGLGSFESVTHYRFFLDTNTFTGYLTDANTLYSEGIPRLGYHIAFPPCPQFGHLTLMPEDLDEWINNDDTRRLLPEKPFIPSSCS